MSRASSPAVESRIRHAIADLLPIVRMESGIELVSYDAVTGTATLRLRGDCPDCSMSAMNLREGIEAHLRRVVPEIRSFVAVE